MGRHENARKQGRRPIRRLAALAALAFFIFVPWRPSWSQDMEYEVKAAFIYNFLRYVDWPSTAFQGPDASINLCVFGHDGVAEAAGALNGRTVKGRRIVAKRVDKIEGLEKCHVLFLGRSEKVRAVGVLAAIRGVPVLAIADFPGFAKSGGTINFVLAGQTVSFEINQESADRSGLKMSSQLLKLAKIVQEEK